MALPIYIRSPLCLAKRLRVGAVRDTVIPVTDRILHVPSSLLAATFATTAYNKQADVKDPSGRYESLLLVVTSLWSAVG